MTGLYSAAMKTAISVPDVTFARVEEAAARLGYSRSEFFARAAERWLAELEDAGTTVAIDAALAGADQDTAFVDAAAARLAADTAW
jgi:metal-responsive CopG/Arc/MetJ family transcriptional regulator